MSAAAASSTVVLLVLLFAAVTVESTGLQQQDTAALPPASEAQSGGGSGGQAPPAALTDAGLGREGAAEEFAVDQPGPGEEAGDVPPGDLPADDVAALLGSEAAALGGSGSSGGGGGTRGGDMFGGAGTEDQPPVEPTDPSKRVGERTGNRVHCSSRAACYIQLPLLSRRSLESLFFAPHYPQAARSACCAHPPASSLPNSPRSSETWSPSCRRHGRVRPPYPPPGKQQPLAAQGQAAVRPAAAALRACS
jgi:hypothetical protein